MNKKIIGIFFCMLMITAAVIPVAGNTIEETSKQASGENRVTIYLPDAHIYFHKQLIKWADVEFDDPGATVDVDLSDLEIRDIIQFNQTVYIHPAYESKQHLIFTQIHYEYLTQGGIELINKDRGWKFYQHVNIRLEEIVENEYYPMTLYLIGVSHFMKLPFLFYWQVIYFRQWRWKNFFPMPLVEKRGNSVEYQIHLHT